MDTATPERQHPIETREPNKRLVRIAVAFAVVAILLLAGIVLLAGWISSRSDRTSGLPPVVERVFPGVGDAMLRQDRVGVDVQGTYWCSLTIDGIRIPDDQIMGAKETGECYYRPGTPTEAGEERAIAELAPGPHTATAEIYNLADPEDRTTFTWRFDVL